MNARETVQWTKQQLAKRWHCDPSVLDAQGSTFLETDDTFFEMNTFGQGTVIRGEREMLAWCKGLVGDMQGMDIMGGDILYQIEAKLRTYGKKLSGEHVRYLRLASVALIAQPEGFAYRWYQGEEVKALYEYKWLENALNFKQDVIAVVAFAGEVLAAAAAADDYMGDMWQIGIDTDPAFRHRGLAAYLVQALAAEIERQGKVPFYTTWPANIASTRVALSAGFVPVWVGYPSEDA